MQLDINYEVLTILTWFLTAPIRRQSLPVCGNADITSQGELSLSLLFLIRYKRVKRTTRVSRTYCKKSKNVRLIVRTIRQRLN